MSDLSLAQLLPVALRGAQNASLPVFTRPETPLLHTLQQHPHPDTAAQLLRLSAVCVRYERVAYQAPNAPAHLKPLTLPSHTQNSAPALTPLLHSLLPKPDTLPTILWLQDLAHRGLHLPASLLPDFLDLARSNSLWRPYLTPILGPQGLFLANVNPDWKFAQGSPDTALIEQTWQLGNISQRVALLQDERQNQPEAARQRLQAALDGKSLKAAKERVALLEVLHLNLSDDDEALLEQFLDDRSREVVCLAAELLAALPNSAHNQRMRALLPLLLQQNDQGQWLLEPLALEQALPQWQRDGIETTLPKYHDERSPKSWLLRQMVRMIPLSAWYELTGMALPQLLTWAKSDKINVWQDTLRRAWFEALSLSGFPDAGEQHLDAKVVTALRRNDQLTPWLLSLPDEQKEAFWMQNLATEQGVSDMVAVLEVSPQALSLPLSLSLLACMTDLIAKRHHHNNHHESYIAISRHEHQLSILIWLVHDDVVPQFTQLPWPPAEHPYHSEWLAMQTKITTSINMRLQWQQALAQHPIIAA